MSQEVQRYRIVSPSGASNPRLSDNQLQVLAGSIMGQLLDQLIEKEVREVAGQGIATRKRSEFIAVRNDNRFSLKENVRCESPLVAKKNSAFNAYYRSSQPKLEIYSPGQDSPPPVGYSPTPVRGDLRKPKFQVLHQLDMPIQSPRGLAGDDQAANLSHEGEERIHTPLDTLRFNEGPEVFAFPATQNPRIKDIRGHGGRHEEAPSEFRFENTSMISEIGQRPAGFGELSSIEGDNNSVINETADLITLFSGRQNRGAEGLVEVVAMPR